MRKSQRVLTAALLVSGLFGVAAPAAGDSTGSPLTLSDTAAGPATGASDLSKLSLEDLMNIEVTSVSKTRQRIADAPAAVYVITQEEIRRSGMTSIPELLRMVPGMEVSRLNGSEWAVSARGFNDLYANKLLVLMDGRAIYTPLFGGVFWREQDYILDDLDRIEAVRGPGATLWGANAVNGVVNIISKSARDTQGGLVEARYGTDEAIGAVRYGGKIDAETYYRVYAKYRTHDDFDFAGGEEAHDGFDTVRSGFRIDRYAGVESTLTVQGDVFSNRAGQNVIAPVLMPASVAYLPGTFDESGGNLLGRWTHKDGPDSEFMVQAYVDRFYNAYPGYPVEQNTFDIEFQHSFRLSRSQQFTWGGDYRYVNDALAPSRVIVAEPANRDAQQGSLYVQDNIALVPERLHLFVGSKLEVNSYSGLEVEPGVRVLWTPNEHHSVWGAISHAVRTPTRADEDTTDIYSVVATPSLPAFLTARGNVGLDSEKLTAYELGYRFEPAKRVSIDIAGFYNRYDDLITYTTGDPTVFEPSPGPHLVIPIRTHNVLFGETYGFELSGMARLSDALRVSASYSYFETALHSHRADVSAEHQELVTEGSAPQNQFQLRAYYDVSRNIELNGAAYYQDNLAGLGVRAFWRVDAGITWRPTRDVEISAGIQNALDNNHPEWVNGVDLSAVTEVPRSIYAQVTWRF